MKNTFLEKPEDLRRYTLMAIADASDLEARTLEQKWLAKGEPTMDDLRRVMLGVVRYPRPLSAANFKTLIERLMIGSD